MIEFDVKYDKNDPKIWRPKFGKRKINSLPTAYKFIYDHPNAYDDRDSKRFNRLSLADRWLESNGQFMNHLDIFVSKKGVFLETGPIYWSSYNNKWATNMHDPRLDVHAKTFEKALIKLAKKVRKYYGNY